MNAQQIQALVDAAQGLLAAQQANNAAAQAQTTTMQGVQATLNGLEQAITNMNQQQQPQAQPQFHEGPFGATTDPGQLIDYKSKAGRWHHKEATTSVFPKDEKFDVEPSKFQDNSGALEMAKVHKYRPRTKHINVKLHHFRSYVESGEVEILPIDTKEQLADYLTKPVNEETLTYLRKLVMGW